MKRERSVVYRKAVGDFSGRRKKEIKEKKRKEDLKINILLLLKWPDI